MPNVAKMYTVATQEFQLKAQWVEHPTGVTEVVYDTPYREVV